MGLTRMAAFQRPEVNLRLPRPVPKQQTRFALSFLSDRSRVRPPLRQEGASWLALQRKRSDSVAFALLQLSCTPVICSIRAKAVSCSINVFQYSPSKLRTSMKVENRLSKSSVPLWYDASPA